MKVLGFSKWWSKLQNSEFTTFRFPRRDRDWKIGEIVQVVYNSRSKNRQVLGTAQIIAKEQRDASRGAKLLKYQPLSETEAQADGFYSVQDMWNWLEETYDTQPLQEPMNKLTLRWVYPTKEEVKDGDV